MKIWLTRHGQTRFNQQRRLQGRIDEPLNENGIAQAKRARERIGEVSFDAVYSSPLDRAVTTASIIGAVNRSDIHIDPRLIEVDFGRYERRPYGGMGLRMTAYWTLPEIFPAPRTVESVASMVQRSRFFIADLEKTEYENVLISCHGGIIRALSGVLMGRKNGIYWRPKPRNCEIRVFEGGNGVYRMTEDIFS